jgi:hypothetical protein
VFGLIRLVDLCGDLVVLQAPIFDSLSFDPVKAKDEHIRTDKWCPEEDSNLHAVTSAST